MPKGIAIVAPVGSRDTRARIRKLLRAGRHEEAARLARKALRAEPDSADHWALLSTVENNRRNFKAALNAIEKAQALDSEPQRHRRQLASVANNLRDFKRSLPLFEALSVDQPDDIGLLDGLKVACWGLGRPDEAKAHGARALTLRDERSLAQAAPAALAFVPREAKVAPGPKKRVIAFSLWGREPRYLAGAMINARLAPSVMPGWRCRFYVGSDLPPAVSQDLRRQGAEVIPAAERHPEIPGYCWRFLAADDEDLAAFLCRDCDSRLSPKDWAAVEDWLASGKAFHVLRDHVVHNELILAGLWGGRGGTGLELEKKMKATADLRQRNAYGADQAFLAAQVWPAIRRHSLTHDSCYALAETRRLPFGGHGSNADHVGAGITESLRILDEAQRFGLPWPIPGAAPLPRQRVSVSASVRGGAVEAKSGKG